MFVSLLEVNEIDQETCITLLFSVTWDLQEHVSEMSNLEYINALSDTFINSKCFPTF